MAREPAGRFAQFDVFAPDAATAEWAAAEAWESGALGIEEREREGQGGGVTVRIWAPAERALAVRTALLAALGEALRAGPVEPAPQRDWSQAWRAGLGPLRVSERLWVRPSFAAHTAAPGQHVLVVDPAQAFGTGHHASTRLALELLDDALAARGPGARVLDVGTGSGVLVLAALALGAGQAVGFDIDPLAGPEARRNARANRLEARARFFTGPLDALAAVDFDVVVANLIRRELLPLLDALCARHLRAGGALVLSGLLATDRARVERELAQRGLVLSDARRRDDAGDAWVGLLAEARA